eukprot:4881049-Alexandrium_andersonii.AAC.1
MDLIRIAPSRTLAVERLRSMWQERQQCRAGPIPMLCDYPASESSSSPPDLSEPDPNEDMTPTQNETSQAMGAVVRRCRSERFARAEAATPSERMARARAC